MKTMFKTLLAGAVLALPLLANAGGAAAPGQARRQSHCRQGEHDARQGKESLDAATHGMG